MRAWMICMVVIVFALSVNIINRVDADYYSEKNNYIFGWGTNQTLNEADTPDLSSKSAYNSSILDVMEPTEQPTGLVDIGGFISQFNWITKGVRWLYNNLIQPILSFGTWLQHLGGSDLIIIEDYLASAINWVVRIIFTVAIIDWLRSGRLTQ